MKKKTLGQIRTVSHKKSTNPGFSCSNDMDKIYIRVCCSQSLQLITELIRLNLIGILNHIKKNLIIFKVNCLLLLFIV